MALFKSLGLFFYFLSIVSYLTLNVQLFNDFYFKILSRYEYQLLILFSGINIKIPELESLHLKYAFADLISHYSLVNLLNANLILILIFVYMLKSKLQLQSYLLSLVFLVASVFPNYYFSKDITEYPYIHQFSGYTLICFLISHLLLGIYIFKTLYRSDALAT